MSREPDGRIIPTQELEDEAKVLREELVKTDLLLVAAYLKVQDAVEKRGKKFKLY